ncbi:MAG: hypothetical protein D6814_11305, partial [Calditrichaeota bacterium]
MDKYAILRKNDFFSLTSGFSPQARTALPLFWIDSIASSDGINFKAINPGLQPAGPSGSPSFLD